MKHCSELSVLLLSVGLLFIGNVVGDQSSENILRIKNFHNLHKRQTPSDESGCDAVIAEGQCTSGYFEEYIHIASYCNNTVTAELLRYSCQQNSMGEFCAALSVTSNRLPITMEAFDACGGYNTTTDCSPEYRQALISTRDRLGCCLTLLNQTRDNYVEHKAFSYSLWSLCDVEPPELCMSSTINLYQDDITNCSESFFLTNLYSALCRQDYLERIRSLRSSSENVKMTHIMRLPYNSAKLMRKETTVMH